MQDIRTRCWVLEHLFMNNPSNHVHVESSEFHFLTRVQVNDHSVSECTTMVIMALYNYVADRISFYAIYSDFHRTLYIHVQKAVRPVKSLFHGLARRKNWTELCISRFFDCKLNIIVYVIYMIHEFLHPSIRKYREATVNITAPYYRCAWKGRHNFIFDALHHQFCNSSRTLHKF